MNNAEGEAVASPISAGTMLVRALPIAIGLAVVIAGVAGATVTGTEFTAANTKLSGLVSGSGGALAGTVSLAKQVVANSWSFNGVSFMQPVGVALSATLGVAAMSAIYGCLM